MSAKEKIDVWKIKVGPTTCVVTDEQDVREFVQGFLNSEENGDITITKDTMFREALEALDDFDGF